MAARPSDHPGAPREAVGAVVVRKDGKVLLVRRRNAPLAGEWSIPGGKVLPGEARADAVRREALEETGLSVTVVAFLETYALASEAGAFLIHEHLCVLDDPGEPSPKAGDDASEAAWATLEEAAAWGVRAEALLVLGRAVRAFRLV